MKYFTRYTSMPHADRNDLANLNRLAHHLWEYRGRVFLALAFLVLAKVAMVGVPLILKRIVDTLDVDTPLTLSVPLFWVLGYGALRLATALFSELRDWVFARVCYRAMSRLSSQVLQHLHQLSLRFHLERKTGAISRDMERGAKSISSILNYLIFSLLPTAAEFFLVAAILLGGYPLSFALVTFITVALYITFTLLLTEWRMKFRYKMNILDSSANNLAVDSLLNYETVKYFNNERLEQNQYKKTLESWERAAENTQYTMGLLNVGQSSIIALGVTGIIYFAAKGVAEGDLSLGDLVLVNALMLQLFLPLNFLGSIYRALKYALADMDLVLQLLDKKIEIQDKPGAQNLIIKQATIKFNNVSFAYNPDRPILTEVNFTIPQGSRIAIVGPSGAGKSTLARLLFRFYDVQNGSITIDDQDIRNLRQQSLRTAIGIVPQDTVLFNNSLYYNIQYANPDADRETVLAAARAAQLEDFVKLLPNGYDTLVGERGLKLSGGEKQRVAIARVLVKQPSILVFDEATSSLDSLSEQAILQALKRLSENITTLIIAHRLSTVVDADKILVLNKGKIAQEGTHESLLKKDGIYSEIWKIQQKSFHAH